jgi:hypothetical protein
MTTITNDTKLEILINRIKKGNDYCNDLWQLIRSMPEFDQAEYNRISNQLDKSTKKLRELVYIASYYGYHQCVFDDCKFNQETYFCFGCTKD